MDLQESRKEFEDYKKIKRIFEDFKALKSELGISESQLINIATMEEKLKKINHLN